jgi:osmoprotectant transport system substrate-binding protein
VTVRAAFVALVAAAAALVGCGGESGPITVGSKGFTEQDILAEMVAQLSAERGARVDRIVPYPDGVTPVGGVVDGTIDVYVEYVGTALLALGLPPLADDDEAFTLVQQESEEFGLTWLPKLGFANDYAIVVTPESAARLDLSRISDLRTVDGPLRWGTDPEYLRRPVDGLDALASRYGLSTGSDVLTTVDKQQLYGALLTGEVDVVQGFSTDPQLDTLDLVVLEDDLDFFPSYDAAPLTRQSLLEAQPQLEQALRDLAGALDDQTMRELIEQVELEQREVDLVARGALIDLGLLPDDTVLPARGAAVVVAIGLDDERSGATGRALDAIRLGYPGRPVEVVFVQDPADAVLRGDARIAIADAETTFQPTDRLTGRERPVKPLEAIAAVELRYVHLLADTQAGTIETIGVGAEDSPSYETAQTLLAAGVLDGAAVDVVPGGSVEDRVDAVASGQVDAVITVSPIGQAEVQQAISADELVLRSIDVGPGLSEQAPHLRSGLIPAESYGDQTSEVTTVTQQAVILAPASNPLEPGVHGPNSFVGGHEQPLAPAAISSIQAVLDEPRVDPVLPRTPLPLTTPDDLVQPTNPTPWVSLVNVLVIVALGALGFAVARRSRTRAPEAADEGVAAQVGGA